MDAESEYRQFVLEAANRLFRTAYVLTNDRQLAEDLVQQTLLKAWRYGVTFARPTTGTATCDGSC